MVFIPKSPRISSDWFMFKFKNKLQCWLIFQKFLVGKKLSDVFILLMNYFLIGLYFGFVLRTNPKSKGLKERYNKLIYQQSESNMLIGDNI